MLLRVLTYNVHHCQPPARPGEIDVEAVAAAIRSEKPEVAMIQELDVWTRRSGADLDQAAELGRRTGMGSFFARAIDFEGGEYGVAILARHPLTDRRVVRLPQRGRAEARVLALATLNLPGGRQVTVACTHLDAHRAGTNRLLQAQAIIEILRPENGPVVLGGDFNEEPGGAARRVLNEFADGFAGEPTFPAVRPTKAIDFVATFPKGAARHVSRTVVEETAASDHRPVLSVIDV